MKKTICVFGTLLVVTAMLVAIVSDIALAGDQSGRRHEPVGLFKTNGSPVSTLININNIAGWIRNDGWSARDPQTGNSGVSFPRGTSQAIFQDGIVWGGNVNDGGAQLLRVGGQTYSIGTIGGRILANPTRAVNPNDPDVRIYRVRRDYKVADLRQDAAELAAKAIGSVSQGEIDAVRAQYETDWNEWPASQGAPYYDRDSNRTYNPAVDEPGVADADQVIWFVCNDLNAGRTNALYGSNPIGLELQVTLWGYNRTDPLANVYFKKFTFIYKGTATTPAGATITDMYVSQWSDPDEGDSGDDFAGCDTSLSVAYVYNAGPVDNAYAVFGLKPPAVGYDFLQGPLVRGVATDSAVFGLKRRKGYKNLPMTAAFYFAAGSPITDPPFTREGTIQWYNLLRGLIPISGSQFVHPNFTGLGPTRFWLDGDPVAGTGRIDGAISGPGDRRIGACSGPFTMVLGDTQEVVIGVVAGIGGDYKNSISVMKNNDIAVQNAYNDLFDLPKAPPAPVVNIVQLDQRLVLDWGSNAAGVLATEEFSKKGYTFQGYNVYQVISQGTSIDLASDKRNLQGRTDVKVLGTFDKAGDAILTITDLVFDSKLGITIPVVKQLGTDNGIVHSMEITTDLIRNGPLVNGQRYYFAVTAYGHNPSDQALTHALESTPRIITAIPQTPNPGVRYFAAPGDTIKGIRHTTTAGGKSDGDVQAYVVDPTALTGHTYRVSFDTSAGKPVWHVTDISVTPNIRKLSGQKNQSGDDWYGNVDGMLIKVLGAPNGVKDFQIVSIGSGAVTPPAYGAYAFNSSGFPSLVPERAGEPATTTPGFSDRPIANVGGARWGIHTGNNADPPSDFDYHFPNFLTRTFRGPGFANFARFVPYDFELRFTAAGGKAYLAFTSSAVINVPFELWNIGIGSPNDPSDDFRMIPLVNDVNGDDLFGLDRVDHTISGGDNDPETDWIYWYEPANKAPGQAGYTTWANNPDPEADLGSEVMARTVLVNLNGGSISAANWPNNVNQRMPETGQTWRIIATKPNRAFADLFEIDSPPASTYAAGAAKADVTRINAFPNPYYGFNRAETSRSTRFVTFNHMPPKVEMRIFNLAGALVRALVKDDPTQYFTWDLNNTGGLPVASGVYIVYMTLKDAGGVDLGTKTLKLVIIQEQQYLDNF